MITDVFRALVRNKPATIYQLAQQLRTDPEEIYVVLERLIGFNPRPFVNCTLRSNDSQDRLEISLRQLKDSDPEFTPHEYRKHYLVIVKDDQSSVWEL